MICLKDWLTAAWCVKTAETLPCNGFVVESDKPVCVKLDKLADSKSWTNIISTLPTPPEPTSTHEADAAS